MQRSIGTTPDPEFAAPCDCVQDGQCRDAPPDTAQAQAAQTPGGGGAPGTGEQPEAAPPSKPRRKT